MTSTLAGKTALVTGGGRGIGAGIARRLADAGAHVIVADVDATAAEATAAVIAGRGVFHDVTDEHAWRRLIDDIASDGSGLDILVNNAGTEGNPAAPKGPQDTPLEDWQLILNVNATGTFLGCRSALALLGDGDGGVIVNVTSVAALLPTPFITAYGASKAAVDQLTRSVALHGAAVGSGVRCNAVMPGQVQTPMLDLIFERFAKAEDMDPAAFADGFRKSIPLQRFQETDDIAAAVHFLASPDSRFITGQSLVVDGGFVLNH